MESANQWIGYYMIETFVMKDLIESLHESEGWDTIHLFLKFWRLSN